MKIIIQGLVIFFILGGLATFTSCDPGPPPKTVEEIQLLLLSKTWNPTAVTLDGVDKLSDYSSFGLGLTGTAGSIPYSYTTTGRPSFSPWPSSGTWQFGTNLSTDIVRDPGSVNDELTITYQASETPPQLQMTFSFSKPGYPARTGNVTGTWIFTFN